MSGAPAKASHNENQEQQSHPRPLWSTKIGGVEAAAIGVAVLPAFAVGSAPVAAVITAARSAAVGSLLLLSPLLFPPLAFAVPSAVPLAAAELPPPVLPLAEACA